MNYAACTLKGGKSSKPGLFQLGCSTFLLVGRHRELFRPTKWKIVGKGRRVSMLTSRFEKHIHSWRWNECRWSWAGIYISSTKKDTKKSACVEWSFVNSSATTHMNISRPAGVIIAICCTVGLSSLTASSNALFRWNWFSWAYSLRGSELYWMINFYGFGIWN